MPSVTTTAQRIPSAGLIQNLGPDEVYIGESSSVTTSTGLEIVAGESLAVGNTNANLYAISAGTSDVRTLTRATGISARAVAP